MVEIATANIAQEGKDEDRHLVRELVDGVWLLAVADGLSMSGGREAARAVIGILERVNVCDSARLIFEELRSSLVTEFDAAVTSETTVTCGLLREVSTSDGVSLRFEFFAVGDSPIWKIVRSPNGSRYAYQRYLVYGGPYPSETAKVYSTVRINRKNVISGSVYFGSVDIFNDEVLIVCTDGIPEREVFVRHQSNLGFDGDPSHELCPWLFQRVAYDDNGISAVLSSYNARGLLYDDATIIAARVSVPLHSVSQDIQEPNELGRRRLVSDIPALCAPRHMSKADSAVGVEGGLVTRDGRSTGVDEHDSISPFIVVQTSVAEKRDETIFPQTQIPVLANPLATCAEPNPFSEEGRMESAPKEMNKTAKSTLRTPRASRKRKLAK